MDIFYVLAQQETLVHLISNLWLNYNLWDILGCVPSQICACLSLFSILIVFFLTSVVIHMQGFAYEFIYTTLSINKERYDY